MSEIPKHEMCPTVLEAMDRVLEAVKQMSPEEIRQRLEANKNGPVSCLFRDVQEMIDTQNS